MFDLMLPSAYRTHGRLDSDFSTVHWEWFLGLSIVRMVIAFWVAKFDTFYYTFKYCRLQYNVILIQASRVFLPVITGITDHGLHQHSWRMVP